MPLYVFLCLLLLWGLELQAQSPRRETPDTNLLQIVHIDELRTQETPQGRYQELFGNVHLIDGDAHFWCDTGFVQPQEKVLARGNVQILQNDSIRVFSDTLRYDGISRKAHLRGEVVLQDHSTNLFTNVLDYDLNTKTATFPFGSLIESDSAKLISRKGTYNTETAIAHFSDSVRLTHPRYKLIADSLKFNTRTEVATFISPTYIYNEEQIVYCEKGFFDSKKRNAEFAQNAYYINRLPTKTEKAKADRILYDGATGNYYLYGNASYSDGNQQVLADTIVRDGQTERYSFRGNPIFKSLDSTKTETISSRNSYYDPQSKIMYFSDSVLVVRNEQRLWADSLAYQEKEKKGRAKGNVVWNDTIQKTTLYCGEAHYNDSAKTVLAFKEPIFQLNLDGDSLWLKADTFYSFVLPFDTLARDSNQVDSFRLDSTERRALKAYHRVQIFKSNFQGLCDSLYYSDKDSIFQFFRAPVLWADSSQFTADTIFLKMRKGKIDQIRLRNNSFIINSEDEVYFNQIKGRNILAQFEAGELRSMDIDAQAETVYYARDESRRYLGVNDVDANRMLVRFGNNQVKRIHFYEEPKAVLYPMRQIDHNKLRLSGFDWQEAKRPRQRFVWQMPVQ